MHTMCSPLWEHSRSYQVSDIMLGIMIPRITKVKSRFEEVYSRVEDHPNSKKTLLFSFCLGIVDGKDYVIPLCSFSSTNSRVYLWMAFFYFRSYKQTKVESAPSDPEWPFGHSAFIILYSGEGKRINNTNSTDNNTRCD